MNRRTFLQGMAGILASGIAPAVLPSGVIMPVRPLAIATDAECAVVLNKVLHYVVESNPGVVNALARKLFGEALFAEASKPSRWPLLFEAKALQVVR